MRTIMKEHFNLMSKSDKIRMYLYFRLGSVSAKTLSMVAGINPRSIYSAVADDIGRGNISKELKIDPTTIRRKIWHFYMTNKGRNKYKTKGETSMRRIPK